MRTQHSYYSVFLFGLSLRWGSNSGSLLLLLVLALRFIWGKSSRVRVRDDCPQTKGFLVRQGLVCNLFDTGGLRLALSFAGTLTFRWCRFVNNIGGKPSLVLVSRYSHQQKKRRHQLPYHFACALPFFSLVSLSPQTPGDTHVIA